jgi:hypothetical protein
MIKLNQLIKNLIKSSDLTFMQIPLISTWVNFEFALSFTFKHFKGAIKFLILLKIQFDRFVSYLCI